MTGKRVKFIISSMSREKLIDAIEDEEKQDLEDMRCLAKLGIRELKEYLRDLID